MAAVISDTLKALTEQTDASSYPILMEVSQGDVDRVREKLDEMDIEYTSSTVGRITVFEADQSKSAITTLSNTSGVVRIDHNPTFKTHGVAVEDGETGGEPTPERTESGSTLSLFEVTELLNIEEAWEKAGTRGEGVKISVIDTAADLEHEAIEHSIVESENNELSGEDHATWVISAISAKETETPDGQKVRGVLPDADIYVNGALSGGSASMKDIISAIEWSLDKDVDIISMSFGGDDSGIFSSIIEEAANEGVTLVSSCGNSGPASGTITSPARYDDVLSVASVGSDGEIASFSSRGPVPDSERGAPDVSAFGGATTDEAGVRRITEAVLGAGADGGYARLMGTSMACPQVAGLCGLKIAQERQGR